MSSCIQVYAIINVFKVAGACALLLYCGITRQDKITDWYKNEHANSPANPSIAPCQSCLDAARINQNTLFEFGYCRTQYQDLAVILPGNLLNDREWFDFSASKSNVHNYLVDTILVTVFSVLLSIILPVVAFQVFGQKFGDGSWHGASRRHHRTRSNRHKDHTDTEHEDFETAVDADSAYDVRDVCVAWNYQIGILTAAMLMAGGLEMTELYFYQYLECYVSPYNHAHLWSATWLFRLLVFLLVLSLFFSCCWPHKWILFAFNVAMTLAGVGLMITGLIMTTRQLTMAGGGQKDWMGSAIVWYGIVHLIETPIMMFACIPRRVPVHYANL